MLKRISVLKIICGLRPGRHRADTPSPSCKRPARPYVVIETHQENVEPLHGHAAVFYKDMLWVIGDATDEEVLEQAGLSRAAACLPCWPRDKDNLVVTVLARQKSPTSASWPAALTEFSERMQKAGANSVVSPNMIGGLRSGFCGAAPHVVGFLDLMIKEHSRTLRIEEILITETSHG